MVILLCQMPKLNAQVDSNVPLRALTNATAASGVSFNGVLQSENISVCDGSSQPLQVDFTVNQATSNAIKVSVLLADGIELMMLG